MPYTFASAPSQQLHSLFVKYGFRSAFSKKTERAWPGYYTVHVAHAQVELTATRTSGIHRYTFPTVTRNNAILLDISHTLKGDACKFASVQVLPNQIITGHVLNAGSMSRRGYFEKFGGGVTIYFAARTNVPFTAFATWNATQVQLNSTQIQQGATTIGAILYGFAEQQVTLYVGISFISVAQAQINLQAETQGKSFDELKLAAEKEWEQYLSQIQVAATSNTENVIKLYSYLYKSALAPTLYTEIGK